MTKPIGQTDANQHVLREITGGYENVRQELVGEDVGISKGYPGSTNFALHFRDISRIGAFVSPLRVLGVSFAIGSARPYLEPCTFHDEDRGASGGHFQNGACHPGKLGSPLSLGAEATAGLRSISFGEELGLDVFSLAGLRTYIVAAKDDEDERLGTLANVTTHAGLGVRPAVYFNQRKFDPNANDGAGATVTKGGGTAGAAFKGSLLFDPSRDLSGGVFGWELGFVADLGYRF